MKQYRILYITLIIVVLDQITKLLIKSSMTLNQSIPVLGDFLRFTYIENTGMAFGIQFGEKTFFTLFAIIASILILFYLFKMKGEHFLARLSVAMILGGAIGNLVDRVIRGGVVDFIDGEFFDIHIPSFKFLSLTFPGYDMERWPVYNIADMAVTAGMIVLLIFIAIDKETPAIPQSENESEQEIIR
jgi:signal peptidase II